MSTQTNQPATAGFGNKDSFKTIYFNAKKGSFRYWVPGETKGTGEERGCDSIFGALHAIKLKSVEGNERIPAHEVLSISLTGSDGEKPLRLVIEGFWPGTWSRDMISYLANIKRGQLIQFECWPSKLNDKVTVGRIVSIDSNGIVLGKIPKADAPRRDPEALSEALAVCDVTQRKRVEMEFMLAYDEALVSWAMPILKAHPAWSENIPTTGGAVPPADPIREEPEDEYLNEPSLSLNPQVEPVKATEFKGSANAHMEGGWLENQTMVMDVRHLKVFEALGVKLEGVKFAKDDGDPVEPGTPRWDNLWQGVLHYARPEGFPELPFYEHMEEEEQVVLGIQVVLDRLGLSKSRWMSISKVSQVTKAEAKIVIAILKSIKPNEKEFTELFQKRVSIIFGIIINTPKESDTKPAEVAYNPFEDEG